MVVTCRVLRSSRFAHRRTGLRRRCAQFPPRAQPTSVPGHSSGCHGPTRPIHRPVSFSMIEKLLKPLTIQAPVNMHMFRRAAERDCGPPRKRVATESATIVAQDSKSSEQGGLNRNRLVSKVGPSMSSSQPSYSARLARAVAWFSPSVDPLAGASRGAAAT
jgi:hypothetical protein